MKRKPLDQGAVDGLCGLYSITNCCRLLYQRQIDDDTAAKLFQALAHSLDSWPKILWDGTEPEDMFVMLDAARQFLAGKNLLMSWDAPFFHEPADNFQTFVHMIKDEIAGNDCFAIIGVSKPWEHWTTIDHFTDKNIMLSDSCHIKELPLEHCDLTDLDSGAEYQFDCEFTYLLSRK